MKVSFVVNNLGASQLSHEIIEFGNKITQDDGIPLLVFFDQMHRHPQQILFSTMNIVEAYNYGGLFITTSVDITQRTLSFPCSKKVLFYIWDLEWIRSQQPYAYWAEIYRNPNLKLIARNAEYAGVISTSFNTPVHYVCQDFKYESLREIILENI